MAACSHEEHPQLAMHSYGGYKSTLENQGGNTGRKKDQAYVSVRVLLRNSNNSVCAHVCRQIRRNWLP